MPCLVLANCCASSEAHHSDHEAWWCCGEVLWNQCSQTLVKKSWRKTWCSLRHLRLKRWFIFQDNDPSMKLKLHKKSWSGQAEISIKLRIYDWTQKRLSTHNPHKTRLSLSSFSKRNGKALQWLTETHPDRLKACEALQKVHQLSGVAPFKTELRMPFKFQISYWIGN